MLGVAQDVAHGASTKVPQSLILRARKFMLLPSVIDPIVLIICVWYPRDTEDIPRGVLGA